MIIVLQDPFVPSAKSSDAEVFQAIPLKDALARSWPSDAHFTLYTIPGESAWPRHSAETLALYPPGEPLPELRYVAADLDFPDHQGTTWADSAALTWAEGLDLDHGPASRAAYYTTRGGLRLVWPLLRPLPVAQATSWISQFLVYLRSTGLPVDDACKDWTRLFRLPRVMRDGKKEEPIAERVTWQPLDWQPVSTVNRVPVQPEPLDLPMPPPALTPLAPDLEPYRHILDTSRLLAGLPLAEPGSRHHVTRSAVLGILNAAASDDPYLPWQILSASYLRMTVLYPDSRLGKLWETCLELAALRRAENAQIAQFRANLSAALRVPESVSFQQLILGCTSTSQYYVWSPELSEYSGPHNERWLGTIFDRQCQSLGVKRGKKTVSALLDEFATPISGVVYDFRLSAKSQVVEGRLHLRGYTPRKVQARYHGDVSQWLSLLAGKHEDNLLKWIATIKQLGDPTCALFLQGPPGAGKSLLANGLVQLWADEPIPYDKATARFNLALAETPLVLVDEAASGLKDAAAFRNLVGGVGLTIEQKFGASASLIGYPRVCIAGNNDRFLRTKTILTPDDVSAVTERIGHIQIGPDAIDFLKALERTTPRYIEDRWVRGRWIAEHALWLEKNIEVPRQGRWLVEGWQIANLAASSEAASDLCILLARAATDTAPPGIFLSGGYFYVQFSELQQLWSRISRFPPTYREIKDALTALSTGGPKQRRVGGRNRRVWEISPALVGEVAEAHGICSAKELDNLLAV